MVGGWGVRMGRSLFRLSMPVNVLILCVIGDCGGSTRGCSISRYLESIMLKCVTLQNIQSLRRGVGNDKPNTRFDEGIFRVLIQLHYAFTHRIQSKYTPTIIHRKIQAPSIRATI